MIKLLDLDFKFKNKTILKNANYEFMSSKLYFLVGKNGVGKSTLFKLINGDEKSKDGKILKEGSILLHRQTPIYFKDMTVKENIQSFIELLEFDIKYEDIEQQYQLEKIRNTVTGKLSGGEKQRLYLAITSLNRDDILLFDEADSALDAESRQFYYKNVLKKFVGMGKSVIVISHNINEVLNYAEGICFLKDNKLFDIELKKLPENIKELNEDKILEILEGMCV